VSLDGKPLDRSYLTHQEIMAGGTLKFVMQASPNKSWAADAQSRPFSMSDY
jgi:putative alpha-1,2-mannosidase